LVDPVADVAITNHAAPDPVQVGRHLTYTLAVTNNGPSDATSVQVVDPLPAGVTYVTAETAGGSCGALGGSLLCELGDLPAGGATQVKLMVAPSVGGRIVDDASVSSAVTDPVMANNTASAVVHATAAPLPQADLRITKTHAAPYF